MNLACRGFVNGIRSFLRTCGAIEAFSVRDEFVWRTHMKRSLLTIASALALAAAMLPTSAGAQFKGVGGGGGGKVGAAPSGGGGGARISAGPSSGGAAFARSA